MTECLYFRTKKTVSLNIAKLKKKTPFPSIHWVVLFIIMEAVNQSIIDVSLMASVMTSLGLNSQDASLLRVCLCVRACVCACVFVCMFVCVASDIPG